MSVSSKRQVPSTGLGVASWFAVFLSPTAYFLLLMFWDKFQLPAPPAPIVIALFCLIPVLALWFCGRAAWQKQMRVTWLALTVLGMAVQVGFLLTVIVAAVTVAISLP